MSCFTASEGLARLDCSGGYSLADDAVIILACVYCGVCCEKLDNAARANECCASEECVDPCDGLGECVGVTVGDANGLGI